MSEEEKNDKELNNEEDTAEEEETEEDQEQAAEPAEEKSPASSRRSRGAAVSGHSAKSVVPMWLWIATVVVLLGFSGALLWKNRAALYALNEEKVNITNGLKTDIQKLESDISDYKDAINEKAQENSTLKGKIGELTEKIRGLENNMTLTKNENKTVLAENRKLQADLDKSNGALKTAQADLAAVAAAREKAAEEMQETKAKLKAAEDMAEGQKRVAAEEMTKRQNLQEEVTALNERVEFLKNKNTEYLETIQELRGEGAEEEKKED